MKSLADFPDVAAQFAAHDEPTLAGHVQFVHAPCCGRFTAADTILDVRAVPGTIVAGGGVRPLANHDWLCCGCQDRMIHDVRNAWTRSMLLSACGAPPNDVREHRARELAEDAARTDYAAGRSHRPDAAKAAARAGLPLGVDPHRVKRTS
jgi:hypothetical protein